MRNLKKFLALVLAMMMAVSLMVTANAQNAKREYPDMDKVTTEFVESVEVLTGVGVFRGNNGDFLPQNKIMRSEAVAILYRLVTGDVEDTQVKLYTPLATYFSDVTENDWFAPYVGFAVDAGYIKGYNGKFNPYANVTGYEMLAMLLRATGYGKNGEFTGAQWQINVGSSAKSLGVLRDIESTHYKNTLSMASAREVVANLTFRVAVGVNTVTWTPAAGYNKYTGLATSGLSSYLNPTLGWRVFHLASVRSGIIGNEATGEDATRLGFGSSTAGGDQVYDEYGYPVVVDKDGNILTRDKGEDYLKAFKDAEDLSKGLEDDYDYFETNKGESSANGEISFTSYGKYDGLFDIETGLDEFAHEVTVWYDAYSQDDDGIYHAYAMIDHNKSDKYFFAKTEKDTTKVVDVLDITTTTPNKVKKLWSDRYSQIEVLTGEKTTNLSPVSTYREIVNPNGTVYVALSAEVARVAQKNTTTKTGGGFLILGSDTENKTHFMNDNKDLPGAIFLDNLTSDTKEEQKKVGALVTAYQVVGTGMTLAEAEALNTSEEHDPVGDGAAHRTDADMDKNHIEDVQYKLAPIETKTIVVKSLKATGDPAEIDGLKVEADADHTPVTQVTPTEGKALDLSGITMGNIKDKKSEIVSEALPIVVKEIEPDTEKASNIQLKAGTSYIAYLDLVGRFISMVPTNNYKFIYGTYADYVIGGLGTGTIAYNIVGVDWDAKVQSENPLKSLTLAKPDDKEISDKDTVITWIDDPAGDIYDIDGDVYSKIDATKKDQGQTAGSGNQILTGADTGYMYNSATGDLAIATYDKMGQGDAAGKDLWTISAQDAKNGFKKVDASGEQWLLTSQTRFIIVDGTGTATVKAEVANGLTELLAGATSATIEYNAGATNGTQNEVIFDTDDTKYGTMYTDENNVITAVILSTGNLKRWNVQTLFFNYDQIMGGNGTYLPGTKPGEVQQFDLWQGKEMDSYFVDLTLSSGFKPTKGEPGDEDYDATATESDLWIYTGDDAEKAATARDDAKKAHSLGQTPSKFFVLYKAYEKNGVDVYMAQLAPAAGGEDDGIGGLEGSGFASKLVTYDYITVTNVHTGLFTYDKDTGKGPDLVLNMDKVDVVDVQYQVAKANKDKEVLDARNEITTVEELNRAVSVGKQAFAEKKLDMNYWIDVAVVYDTSNNSAITVYVLDAVDLYSAD